MLHYFIWKREKETVVIYSSDMEKVEDLEKYF
jgi:hypothetical protein